MRLSAELLLFCLALAGSSVLAATDKLDEALGNLASIDPSAYEKARAYLLSHRQEAEPRLTKVFQEASDPLARLRAARLLGALGDSQSVDPLSKRLSSGKEDNPAVRVEIVRSLWQLNSKAPIIDYCNSGRETTPSVVAAIAVALQGPDENSKEALGRLLKTTNDPRVFRAAALAISLTYGLDKSGGTPKPTKNNQPLHDLAQPNAGKKDPSAGDLAVFDALKAKQASQDQQVSQQAAALLQRLAQLYKQP